MPRRILLPSLVAVAALLAGGVALAAGNAHVTPAGAGGVKLGATFRSLRAAGLVGRMRHGCEVAGPRARSASLRGPLRGTVDLTDGSPRRVADIVITGGASARGVRVGSSAASVRAAFPKARFDHRTDATFGVTIAKVPRGGGGRIQFAVDTKTHRVALIGVPLVPFCE